MLSLLVSLVSTRNLSNHFDGFHWGFFFLSLVVMNIVLTFFLIVMDGTPVTFLHIRLLNFVEIRVLKLLNLLYPVKELFGVMVLSGFFIFRLIRILILSLKLNINFQKGLRCIREGLLSCSSLWGDEYSGVKELRFYFMTRFFLLISGDKEFLCTYVFLEVFFNPLVYIVTIYFYYDKESFNFDLNDKLGH